VELDADASSSALPPALTWRNPRRLVDAAPARPPASVGVVVTCLSFSGSSKVYGVTTEAALHPSQTGNPARKFRRDGATCAFSSSFWDGRSR
jgi:hypothetical protein